MAPAFEANKGRRVSVKPVVPIGRRGYPVGISGLPGIPSNSGDRRGPLEALFEIFPNGERRWGRQVRCEATPGVFTIRS